MKKIIFFFLLCISVCLNAQVQVKVNEELYHQFDFWIGKWDVYYFGTEKMAGKSHIEQINDGKALLENYKAVDINFVGKSLNKYNSVKERWEEFWVDNTGRTLTMSGNLKDGKMIMDDKQFGDPKQSINQMTWEKLPNGSVRQIWTVSTDEGKTWKTIFDGEYKKSKE